MTAAGAVIVILFVGKVKSHRELISIIVTESDKVEMLNDLLHEYSGFIIGRMGIPYREKGISIISIAIDAPMDEINSLTGALGRLDGINAKVTYAKV